MKRVLSLVLALVLVLGMIPTFAAEMTGADHLYEHEFIAGDGTGNLMTEQLLTREQLAKLVLELAGVLDEAEALTLPPSYGDAAKISAWARSYVSFAQVEGLMKGYTNGNFGPQDPVSGQMLAQVLTRALGYEFPWATVVADAADLGIDVAASAKLTRGDAFEAMWATVNLPMKGETLPLGVKLGKLPDPTPVVLDFDVAKIATDNLKQVVVEFTQAVDEDTIDIAGSDATVKYYLNGGTAAQYFSDFSVSEDGKVVTFVAATFTQSDELKVVVDGVKNAAKDVVEDHATTIVAKDVTNPEVVSLTLDNSKQITVTFSEPINLTTTAFAQRTNELKIDDVTIVASAAVDYANNQVVYTLGSKLAVGEHKIWLGKLNDFANFKTAEYTQNVTLVEDKTAPVVTGVEVVSPAKIKVTFNESVSSLGTVTVDEATTLTTSSPVWNAGNTVVTLTLSGNLTLVSLVEATLVYDETTDAEGNASDEAEFVFKATDDTTKPTATVEISATNKITVTFSESMATSGTFTIKDADGTTVATLTNPTFKTGTSDTVVEIAPATIGFDEVDAENYTVEVKNSTDGSVRANVITKFTATVATVDTKNPTIVGTILTDSANDKLTMFFSEVMDSASVTNEENYLVALNGTDYVSLSTITDASIAYSNDKVVITLPDVVGNTSTIKVLLVKDSAGNTIATNMFNVAKTVANPATFTHTDVAVELIAKNQIRLTATGTTWGTVDPAAFVVYDDTSAGDDDKLVGVSTSLNAAGDKLTVTLNGNIGSDTTFAGNVAKVYVNGTAKNFAGTQLVIAKGANAESLTDKVKPTFVSAKVKGTSGVNANTIVLTFDESVQASDGANGTGNEAADYTALEYDLKVVVQNSTPLQLLPSEFTTSVAGGKVELVITKAGIDAKNVTVELLNGRYLVDASAQVNASNVFAAVTVSNTAASANASFDTVAPTASVPSATSTTTNDADSLVITLTEALYSGGTAVVSGSVAANVTATTDANNSITGITAAYDATAKTITIAIAGTVTADADQITFNFDQYTDAYGNAGVDVVYEYESATSTWVAQ